MDWSYGVSGISVGVPWYLQHLKSSKNFLTTCMWLDTCFLPICSMLSLLFAIRKISLLPRTSTQMTKMYSLISMLRPWSFPDMENFRRPM